MHRPRMRLEQLEPRCLLSATVFEHDDIGYFLDADEARIERYDIAHETWLASITLAEAGGPATVGYVDDDGIYVAERDSVYRYELDGTGRTHLADTAQSVWAIQSDGDLLLVDYTGSYGSSFLTIDKTTNAVVGTFSPVPPRIIGRSFAPGLNRIYGTARAGSYHQTFYLTYDDAGSSIVAGDGPWPTQRYGASLTWLYPDESKVIDSNGTVLTTSGLELIDSISENIDDVDFVGDNNPIVLRDKMITAYTSFLTPTGRAVLQARASQIFVNDTNVIAFTRDDDAPHGYLTELVSLDALNAATPDAPIDPVGLAYTPDDVEIAADDTVLLFNSEYASIFRWDPETRTYVDSILLAEKARYMAYSADTNTIYLVGDSGQIRSLDLDAAEPVEVPFATLPAYPFGLHTAGPYLFVAHHNSDPSHFIFGPDGTLIDTTDWWDVSREYVWSEANQKMYFTQDYSPHRLRWAEINVDGVTYPDEPPGGIGETLETRMLWTATHVRPIRVAPDGSVVVTASGGIHDAHTLERLTPALANPVADAAWVDGRLFTIRNHEGLVQFQHWMGPTYEPGRVASQTGTAHSLHALPYHLLAITIGADGVPLFSVLDDYLEPVPFYGGFAVFDTLGDTSVSESGTTDTLQVMLQNQPADEVVMTVSSSDTGEATVSPASLTFGPGDWYRPQIVTVTGRNDDDVDGDQISFVTFSVDRPSSDRSFWNAPDEVMDVLTADDETVVPAVMEHGGVGYFFVENDNRIERYDIAEQTWLDPVRLADATGELTTAHVDDDGIYVAYGKAVFRHNLDGSQRTHLLNASHDVIAIHSDGNLLLLNITARSYARFASIDKTTHAVLDFNEDYVETVFGSSIAPDVNRIFGRKSGSPADITYVAYDDDGQFTKNGDSRYHGDYERAERTWVFPDNAKVVDSSGIIYSTSDLTFWGCFPVWRDEIDQLIFHGDDVPIVLSGNTVTAYTPDILPSGSATLSGSPTQIFVNETNVIALTPDPTQPTGFVTEVVSLADLALPEPVDPVDPVGLAYVPDTIELAADGTVLLFSSEHEHIFRWDPEQRDYVDSIPLVGRATHMAYSPALNNVYLAYRSGLIQSVDLDDLHPREFPFAALPYFAEGLETAGEYVFAVDPSGSWYSCFTFAEDGTRVELDYTKDRSREFVWSDANQKMYHYRNVNYLEWHEINADGTTYPDEPPGGIGDYKSTRLDKDDGSPYPLRVAPDGSVVVLGSGVVYDAITLQRKTVVGDRFSDATWIGEDFYTITDYGGESLLWKRLGSDFTPSRAAHLHGTPRRLINIDDDRLLAVTLGAGGAPVFTLLDEDLNLLLGGRIDTRLARTPTLLSDPVTGEVNVLPGNEEWLDEWTEFYVEFWVSSLTDSTLGVERTSFELTYNTDLTTAVDMELGPAFDVAFDPPLEVGETGVIYDPAGRVLLKASTAATDVGDDRPALLARIHFAPTAADPGVPHVTDGHYLLPGHNLNLLLSDIEMDLDGGSPVATDPGEMPDPELWPVMYDMDDDGRVSFGDSSYFAAAFFSDVGDPAAEFAWAGDFDRSGRVYFPDFSFFSANFGRSRDSALPVAYPRNFPEDWRGQPQRAALAPPPAADNVIAEAIDATFNPFVFVPHSAFSRPHFQDLPSRVVDGPRQFFGEDHPGDVPVVDPPPPAAPRLPETSDDGPAESLLDEIDDADTLIEPLAVDPNALDRVFAGLD